MTATRFLQLSKEYRISLLKLADLVVVYGDNVETHLRDNHPLIPEEEEYEFLDCAVIYPREEYVPERKEAPLS